MVYILGINPGSFHYNHDSSACLIKDGEIIAFASEERFDRIKHSFNFPTNAITFCLNYAGISEDNVDYLAMNWVPKGLISSTFSSIGFHMFNLHNAFNRYVNLPSFISIVQAVNKLKKRFPGKKIFKIPHHLAHAASAFRVSGFKKSNILAIDGRGEKDAMSFFVGNDNIIEKQWSKNFFDNFSIGLCYTLATNILGLGRNGEGKTMGLAPYGKPILDFSDIIDYNGSVKSSIANYSKLWSRFIKFRRNPKDELTELHKNLAATLQKTLEDLIAKTVEEINNSSDIRTMCLGGGVALNCVTNGILLEKKLVKDIYVQPAASDDGGALGAALEAYALLGKESKTKMEHAYWGPEFSNEEIEQELKKTNQKFEFYNDIAGEAAELIAKGKTIGWFQGRMEIGPRALGNRSILADPRDLDMWKKVNAVKGREVWRPLAPSMLEDAIDEYFENPYPSPFMILSFTVKEDKVKEIPAVVHVDNTTRPQTVTKKTNPLYYDLIKNFEETTSVPLILNTSFNEKSEPIVCTPTDAIKTFNKTNLDYLVIGNYVVSKG